MKTAIITGASRGIGKEIAIAFASKSYHVILLARNKNDLTKTAQHIQQNGGTAELFSVDVTDENRIQHIVQQTLEKHQKIDLLVNNAGIGTFKFTDEISLQEWENVMNVNVKGTFLMTKSVLPSMKNQRNGHIITIASDVSKRTFASGSLYCTSKFAQDAYMIAVRKEVRSFDIRVSTIYPGITDTYFAGNQPSNQQNQRDSLSPQAIADAVLYVASTPKNIVIDELMIHPLGQDY